jgi:hypothetical protein
MPHDLTMPYRAANIEYAEKVFNRCLYLGEPAVYDDDRKVINAQWVLGAIDAYNRFYAGTDTGLVNSPQATKAIANKQFVDYCADNGLIGRCFFKGINLSGDSWNQEHYYNSHQSVYITVDCIASVSFNYHQVGRSITEQMCISLIEYNTDYTIKNHVVLFGDGAGNNAYKYDLKEGENRIDNITLNKGYELYIDTYGLRPGQGGNNTTEDVYGVIENLNVICKLKTNEVIIPTPLTINTKTSYGNVVKEFPVEKAGTYDCSFFAYDGNYNSYNFTTEKIVKFSLIDKNGKETVLYENPANFQSDVYAYKYPVKKSVAAGAGGKFRMECKVTTGYHGVVECLTIKGTI